MNLILGLNSKTKRILPSVCVFFILSNMGAAINIQGRRFGNLTVMYRNGSNTDKKAVWLCKCDCGTEVNKTWLYLKKGKELFCGITHPSKICTQCKLDKDKKTGYSKSANPIGVQSTCKKCQSENHARTSDKVKEKYYAQMKDPLQRARLRKNARKSWVKKKVKDAIYKKEYNKRPEVIERRRKRHHERKNNDLQYAITKRLRGRVRDCLKSLVGGHYKHKSSLVMLGCDLTFFKEYIESKFEYGMNWDRLAYIHLDHIVPCSHFDLTKPEEQLKCFHYTNMQPLWEVDNLVKSYMYNGKMYPKKDVQTQH